VYITSSQVPLRMQSVTKWPIRVDATLSIDLFTRALSTKYVESEARNTNQLCKMRGEQNKRSYFYCYAMMNTDKVLLATVAPIPWLVIYPCDLRQTLLRIWDCFLVEGSKVLFRFSVAILTHHQDTLVSQPDTISIMRFLKTCTRLLFDADGLVKVWELPSLRTSFLRRDSVSGYLKYFKISPIMCFTAHYAPRCYRRFHRWY